MCCLQQYVIRRFDWGRGLIQARNVLANLGKKHNKATLEPACQQVLDKKLAGLAPGK